MAHTNSQLLKEQHTTKEQLKGLEASVALLQGQVHQTTPIGYQGQRVARLASCSHLPNHLL